MRLIELKPKWLKYKPEGDSKFFAYVDSLQEADGILFICPKCFIDNNMDFTGVHSVICWFEDKVPDELDPKPGRWNPVGNSYDDLTFVPGKKTQSIQLLGGCNWHGYMINGDVA